MCRSEPSLSHDYHVTEGHVSSKVCRSPRQSLTPRALSATRELETRELETTAGNSSCDKAEERTEHARYQLEIHLTVTLCYDFKGNYKVCRSTVFVSQLSSTVARKCKLRLGEEGIRSRIPVSSLHSSSQMSVSNVQTCQAPKVFYAVAEDANALSTEMADASELI